MRFSPLRLMAAGALFVLALNHGASAQDAEQPAPKPGTAESQPAPKPVKKPAAAKKPAAVAPKLKARNVGNWVVTCPVNAADATACSASLQMVDQKRKLRLLTMSIGRNPKGALILEAVTPTGVLIAPGVTMQAGKIKSRSPYVSCADAGCLSRYAVTESMLAALKANTTIKFTVVALPNNVINIEAKPKGTTEVLAQIGK
jgi:invasion protein IalB